MCKVCALVLRKLISRGLVSEGNVLEQIKELSKEGLIQTQDNNLHVTAADIGMMQEDIDNIIHRNEKKGYDA
jgi:hypothetical protein